MKICYIFLSVICLLSLSIAETTENLQEQDAYQLPAEHEVTKLKNNLTILIKQHEEIKKKQLDFLDMYSETKKEIDNFIESVRENDVVRDNDVYFLPIPTHELTCTKNQLLSYYQCFNMSLYLDEDLGEALNKILRIVKFEEKKSIRIMKCIEKISIYHQLSVCKGLFSDEFLKQHIGSIEEMRLCLNKPESWRNDCSLFRKSIIEHLTSTSKANIIHASLNLNHPGWFSNTPDMYLNHAEMIRKNINNQTEALKYYMSILQKSESLIPDEHFLNHPDFIKIMNEVYSEDFKPIICMKPAGAPSNIIVIF